MPDISMCLNASCERRGECYRYRAIPFKIQTYSLFNSDGGKCEWFMPLVDGDILRDTEDVDEKMQGM